MGEPIFKIIELAGTSHESIEAAAIHALQRANLTLRHLQWFQITETRGRIKDGRVDQWQVVLKVGVELEPAATELPHP